MITLASHEQNLVNERKFVGDALLGGFAVSALDARCLPDGDYPVGHINSIYFDAPDATSFDEKEEGDNIKMKIRMRWYGSPAEDTDREIPVFIEIKHRLGSARRKVRHVVSAPGRWISKTPLDDPSFPAFLYRQALRLPEPIPLHWIPSVCISYDRHRYVCPQTESRVAVDKNIRTGRANSSVFGFFTPIELPFAICEFKNQGGEAPPWAELLYNAGFRLRSFSKYGECINQIRSGATPYE